MVCRLPGRVNILSGKTLPGLRISFWSAWCFPLLDIVRWLRIGTEATVVFFTPASVSPLRSPQSYEKRQRVVQRDGGSIEGFTVAQCPRPFHVAKIGEEIGDDTSDSFFLCMQLCCILGAE